MSARRRILWAAPVLVAASWLAVRSRPASAVGPDLPDPPVAMSGAAAEIRDPMLARFIARFADTARAGQPR